MAPHDEHHVVLHVELHRATSYVAAVLYEAGSMVFPKTFVRYHPSSKRLVQRGFS